MTAYPLTNLRAHQASLPLSPQAAPAPRPRPGHAAHARQLWVCTWFPALPLEAAERRATTPFAIVEGSGARRCIYMACAAASRAGVVRGMPLAQAYALCPRLNTQIRDPIAEMRRLKTLAAWANQFTPAVSLQPPQALLLEISGSLRLFGGLEKLKIELNDGLAARGAHAHIAITPTPLASLLLASQGQASEVFEPERLRSALGHLPVRALPLSPEAIRRLLSTGVRSLHDLWRLPREGLARRLGPELLDFMDRALGLQPDPRSTFHPPPRFTAGLELPWETEDADALLEATRRLLARLIEFLRAHDAGVTRLRLVLNHAQSPASRLSVGTRHATRDETHLLKLLEEHLCRLQLPAPVLALRLITTAIQPYVADSGGLFARQKSSAFQSNPAKQQLLERLQAHLGREAVRGLVSVADHRPEQAWSWADTGNGRVSRMDAPGRRPLWLLPEPRPLAARRGQPWRHGRLIITSDPERIESGWWNGRDVRRDYYIVKDIDGSRLWIYRDLRGDRSWYLHGLFG
ncbi:MAG: Y-family DNA polymerase [Gammaproteobacteria bacterium]